MTHPYSRRRDGGNPFYIPEAEKVVRCREQLRRGGCLPEVADTAEYTFAVFDAIRNGWFTSADSSLLMEALLHAWTHTSIPTVCVSPDKWRAVFDAVSHTASDHDAALPSNIRTIEVFRGAPLEHRDGLSWTTDRNTAAWFARRRQMHPGRVYRAVAPREAVIADLRRFVQGENEVLVRPDMLRDVSEVDFDIEKAVRARYRRAVRMAREARAQGFECPEPELPRSPQGLDEAAPLRQYIDPTAPGYMDPPWTPDGVIWGPRDQTTFRHVEGAVLVQFPYLVREA